MRELGFPVRMAAHRINPDIIKNFCLDKAVRERIKAIIRERNSYLKGGLLIHSITYGTKITFIRPIQKLSHIISHKKFSIRHNQRATPKEA